MNNKNYINKELIINCSKRLMAGALAFSLTFTNLPGIAVKSAFASNETSKLTVTKGIAEDFIISKPEVNAKTVTFSVEDKKGESIFNKYWKNIKDLKIDDRSYKVNTDQSYDSKGFILFNNEITVTVPNFYEIFSKNTKHKIEFYFNDGSIAKYEEDGYVKNDDVINYQNIQYDVANEYLIKKVFKTQNYENKELVSINIDNISSKDTKFRESVKKFIFNGNDLTQKLKDNNVFLTSMSYDLYTHDSEVIKLFKEKNEVEIEFNDGSKSVFPNDGNVIKSDIIKNNAQNTLLDKKTKKNKGTPIKDLKNLSNGEYTIGFNALYADGRKGSSMLEGFFDKNIKLVVKDGKYTITMLNTLFAYSLIDFGIENKNNWSSAIKKDYGNTNSAGQYDRATFSMDIDDLTKEHMAGVLVGYMGGLPSQKSNFDKYTKVKIKFANEVYKGWDDFAVIEEEKIARAKSDEILQKKLIANGVDKNKDGKVTPEELMDFEGDINIGSIEINGAIDKGAIYDISLLKNMGPKVKSFKSDSNKFGELPKDLFAKAVNIQEVILSGNNITNIPKELFKNNSKITKLYLSSNKLGKLPEGVFDSLTELKDLSLDNTWLSSIPESLFSKMKKLEILGLQDNKLKNLPDKLFEQNKNINILTLGNNELKTIPKSIGNLEKLNNLSLPNNNLEIIPKEVGNLKLLKEFNASNNNLSELPEQLWANLAKNNAIVRLDGNKFSKLPDQVIKKSGQLQTLDIAFNYLSKTIKYDEDSQKKLGIHPSSVLGYYPQRTSSNLILEAKDGVVTSKYENDKMTILNLLHWKYDGSSYYGGKEVIQGYDEYIKFMDELSSKGKSVINRLEGKNWEITTKLERFRNGNVKEIISSTTKNENDITNKFNDPDMKKGDRYKVTKTIYEYNSSTGNNKVTEISQFVDANVSKEFSNVESEIYEVPVFLKNASSEEASMGNAALNSLARVIKSKKGINIIISLKSLYLKSFDKTGHVTKLGYYPSLEDMKADKNLKDTDVFSTYEENGIKYPKEIIIPLKDMKTKFVGLKIWVDAMDDIAKLSGKKEGPQPAVLVIDWAKSKFISKGNDFNINSSSRNNAKNYNLYNEEYKIPKLSSLKDLYKLRDGKYLVDIKLIKINRKEDSMANGAILPTAILEKNGGDIYITLEFKGMKIGKKVGYLGKLSYYDNFTYDENLKPVGRLLNGEVLEYQSDGKSPKIVRIPLVKSALNDKSGFIPLHVFVDVMEKIGLVSGRKGMGEQDVLLKLNLNTVRNFDKNNRLKSPNTGDSFNVNNHTFLIIASGITFIFIAIRRRKDII
ncbi:NEAT domain-containing protein [Helcococcus ovis]|nr:NEAT domain-containing protein [Helcococcus ovis]TFF64620.1 hypothetical protein EQF92_05045 [Helcococcus ovis]